MVNILTGIGCCVVIIVIAAIVAAVVVTQNNDVNVPSLPGSGNSNNKDGPTAAPTVFTGIPRCNGLENLCGVRVNDVLFATMHNAMATAQDGTTFLYNHEFSLERALDAGWRGINIDIGKCNGEIKLVHGDCTLLGYREPLEVFGNIATFLQNHPNDVILMPVQMDSDTGGEVTMQELWALMQQVPGFTDLLYAHPGRGAPWPTLRTLLDNGTRLLFFHYNGERCAGNSDCPSAALHDYFDYALETAFEFDSVSAVQADSCAATRGINGEQDFLGVNLFLRIPGSCSELNSATFLSPRLTDCATANGGIKPNLIIADCWDVGDVLMVVNQHNAMLESANTQNATVTMVLTGLSSEMGAAEEAAFVTTCSRYFSSQLTDWSNVGCQVNSQTLQSSSRQRWIRRYLQTTASLQVEVQVSGDANTDSASALSPTLVESVLDSSASELASSLASVNAFYASVEAITYIASETTVTSITAQMTNEPMISIAPSPIPTSDTTVTSTTTSTTVPSSSITAFTRSPSDSPILIDSTASPSPFSAPSDTPSPSPAASNLPPDTSEPTTEAVDNAAAVPSDAPFAEASISPSIVVMGPSEGDGVLQCNGLENLCDIPANNVLFATVHNAPSTSEAGFQFVPNHRYNFEGALEAGYRGINFDIGKCGGEVQLVHANCGLGSREPVAALTNIVSFLKSNPNEVIIIPTQVENNAGGGVITLAEIDALLQSVAGFKNLMYQHPGPGTNWPTLRELIEANTRILFFHFNGDEYCSGSNAVSCPSGFNDWFRYVGESEFEFTSSSQFSDPSYSCKITRGPGANTPDFYGVNVFLQLPNLQTCGELNTREFLVSHLEACGGVTGYDVNVLVVDCWDEGDVLDVVREYNQAL